MNDAQIIKLLVVWVAVIVVGVLVGYSLAGSPQLIIATVVSGSILAFVAFRGMNTQGLSQLQAVYYIGFVGVLAVVWSPFKAVAYATPALFTAFFVLLMSVGRNGLILMRTLFVLGVWGLLALIYKGLNPDFIDQNALVALMTYGSIVPIAVIPNQALADSRLFIHMMKVLVIVAMVEFSIGVFQGFWGILVYRAAVWDFVEGTMHIQLQVSSALDTVMFACNSACIVLALIAYTTKGNPRWYVFALGILALLLGSVVHLVMVLIVAAAMAYILTRPVQRKSSQRRMGAFLMLGMVMLPILFLTVFRDSVEDLPRITERTLSNRNPKTRILVRSLEGTKDRYPMAWTMGIGPGQNGSRACLISAGYLGRLPQPLQLKMTPVFAEYGLDEWIRYMARPFKSSSNRPASSWVAVILEFGFLGFFLVLVWLAYLVSQVLRAVKNGGSRIMAFSIVTTMLLIFGLGGVELYWEVPQAIFAPILVLKVMYANLVHGSELSEESDDPSSDSSDSQSKISRTRPIRSPALEGFRITH